MANTNSLHALLDETGWIHALARRLVTDPHMAADLAQETTLDALEGRPDGSRPLRGWLATVMRNKLAKLRRGQGNRSAREATRREDGELAPAALEVVERAETHRNVVLAVLALDEPYRSTLLMRFFEQLSYDEIALRTGVTRAAVNSRVTRGLEQLRARLENTYGGDRRALCLALTPLAKLPTGVATTTILGLKTMHFVIGTAAATLLAASVSLSVLAGNRTPHEPTLTPLSATSPAATEGVELLAPPGLEPREAAPAAAAQPQREPQQPRKQAQEDRNVWKTELSSTIPLANTVTSVGVNTGSGDIDVQPSFSGRVEITAKVNARLDRVSADRLTQVFADHVRVVEEDGCLRIEDRHNNEQGWSVSFQVSVPGKLPLSANSGSGDVIVRNAAGQVAANTGSGDVRVELAGERLESLAANTGSGDVRLEVLSVEKALNANTGSGEVALRVADPSSPGKVQMNSGSGDLLLVVPGGISGSFDAQTFSGELVVDPSLGLVTKKDISGLKSAHGTIGNGTASYRMHSGSGDLTVSIGNALPQSEK